MIAERLETVLSKYIEHFGALHGEAEPTNEWGKWDAVRHFIANWDLDAPDFAGMFSDAMKLVQKDGLLEGQNEYPVSGIKKLIENGHGEFVREQFMELFSDDGGDLNRREMKIESFLNQIAGKIEALKGKGSLFVPNRRHVIWMLMLGRPDENFPYKYESAHEWAVRMDYGFEIESGSNFSLEKYYGMCEETLGYIRKNNELRSVLEKKKGSLLDEADWHITVYDLIYCSRQYGLAEAFPMEKMPEKERVARHQKKAESERLNQRQNAVVAEADALKAKLILSQDLVGMKVHNARRGDGIVAEVTYVDLRSFRVSVSFGDGRIAYGISAFEDGFLIPQDKQESLSKVLAAYKKAVMLDAERKLIDKKLIELRSR